MGKDLISDFVANCWWELILIIMLTSVARIFKLTFGKKMTTRHELIFWFGCVILGTISLALVNAAIISPIKEKLTNLRISSPNIKCSFINGQVNPPYNGSSPCVFYQLKIVNSGSPSVVWRWKLTILFSSGEKMDVDAAETPSNQRFIAGETVISFDSPTYLPNALLESPLSSGAGKSGWVTFKVDNATVEDLGRIGNKFILKFEDCDGNQTTITNAIYQKGNMLQEIKG